MLVRFFLTPVLPLALLLSACGGSAPEPEPPEPVPVLDPGTDTRPDAASEPESEEEAEPEAEPDYMSMADAAAARGDLPEARRLYGEAATATGVTPEQFAYAELKIALLYLLMTDEPDLEAARLRLDRAVEASPSTARLEVEALLKLLDGIRDRDETVRRLTELIGTEG